MTQPLDTAEIVRRWMRDILTRRDWSAERWAREAGVSPTTITRFLNGAAQHVPTYRTLRKLADAAYARVPDIYSDHAQTFNNGISSVALIYPDDVASADIRSTRTYYERVTERRVMVVDGADQLLCAAVVTRDTYDGRGILPGDVVHVTTYDGSQDKPVLVRETGPHLAVYRIEGDWLMPFSTHGYPPRPVQPDAIIGYVVKLERPVD